MAILKLRRAWPRALLTFAVVPFALGIDGCEAQPCTAAQVLFNEPGCGERATINSPPIVSLRGTVAGSTAPFPFPELGQEVNFHAGAQDPDNDRVYYEWDFNGDGEFEKEGYADDAASVDWTYRGPGVFHATVRVSDFPALPGGEGQTIERLRVRVHTAREYERDRPPTAVVAVDPNPTQLRQETRFDASQSSDPDGDFLSYSWELPPGEASLQDPHAASVSHGFSAFGDLWARLTLYDDFGKSDIVTQPVSVLGGPPDHPGPAPPADPDGPLAALDVEPPDIAWVGQRIRFSGLRSQPFNAISLYEWDLDGQEGFERSTNEYFTHQHFDAPGEFPVRLRVTDDQGRSSTVGTTVHVTGSPDSPRAILDIDPNPAQPGEPITFDASRSTDPNGDIVSYDWDVDAELTYELHTEEPTIVMPGYGEGEISVGVLVNDADGNATPDRRTLVVERPSGRASRDPRRATTRARGVPRPFSAVVSGSAERGRLEASFNGPKLRKPERIARRFLESSWRTRLRLAPPVDDHIDLRGLALAREPRTGDRACVRLRIQLTAGELPRGTLNVLGGTGAAARLRTSADYRFRVEPDGPATIVGTVRSRFGQQRGLPQRCGRLAAD